MLKGCPLKNCICLCKSCAVTVILFGTETNTTFDACELHFGWLPGVPSAQRAGLCTRKMWRLSKASQPAEHPADGPAARSHSPGFGRPEPLCSPRGSCGAARTPVLPAAAAAQWGQWHPAAGGLRDRQLHISRAEVTSE